MHPYSTIEDDRRRVIIVLCAALGSVLAWLISLLAGRAGIDLPWWVDAPGLFGGLAAVWSMYDKWGWKTRWLSKIPDLSGTWDGNIYSSYAGGTVIPARLTIRQSATRIQIHLRTERSQSSSTMALVSPGGDGADELHYSYSNRPSTVAEATMHPHDGWADLTLTREGSDVLLAGDYETNRHRKTTGQMSFRRIT